MSEVKLMAPGVIGLLLGKRANLFPCFGVCGRVATGLCARGVFDNDGWIKDTGDVLLGGFRCLCGVSGRGVASEELSSSDLGDVERGVSSDRDRVEGEESDAGSGGAVDACSDVVGEAS